MVISLLRLILQTESLPFPLILRRCLHLGFGSKIIHFYDKRDFIRQSEFIALDEETVQWSTT